MIQSAIQHPKIKYILGPAEKLPFRDNSVDMVVAGQAGK